jgi:peptide methionine sulfoxide reductase msrA/msrB
LTLKIWLAQNPRYLISASLVKFFFEIHDPEQANGQGPDIGPQYLSAIFHDGDKEKAVASHWKQQLQNLGYQPVTQLIPKTEQTPFSPAEAYHQDYYQKTGKTPYCHRYQPKFK